MFPFHSLLVTTPHRSISIKEKISMKARNLILSACFLFAFLTVAYAAGIDGKWTAQVPGRQGNTQETTFTFKAEGEKLTGTVTGRMGETAISDGTIKGNDVSFKVVREFNGNKITQVFKGVLSGDEIKFSRTMEGGPGGGAAVEFTAKRAS
jgi:Na+-transporting NADH:ubiquinone oxidoreductase subunit NqrB